MPDLAALTADQNAALREHEHHLATYRQAVERRMNAQAVEFEALATLQEDVYRIAGVDA